jgi:formate dehydrogenase maturation protein FdhE
MKPPKGKPVGFETIKRGKTLLKLQDGNYLQCELVVNKVAKGDVLNSMGEPEATEKMSCPKCGWSKWVEIRTLFGKKYGHCNYCYSTWDI